MFVMRLGGSDAAFD